MNKSKSLSLMTRIKAALNAAITVDPDTYEGKWLLGLPLYSALSAAGVEVSEEDAIRVMAVYACIRVISAEISASPLHFMRWSKAGKERLENRMSNLLRYEPNSEMTASDFKKTMQLNMELWGNAYAEIIRSRAGEVLSLWPIPSWRVTEKRNDAGKLEYHVIVGKGEVVLPEHKVLHLRSISNDGLAGWRFVELAKNALGLAIATETYGSQFFKYGANASGIVTYPGQLGEDAWTRFKASFKESYEGLTNAQRLIFLEDGMKFEQLTIPNDAAQFSETRTNQMLEICRFYGVPPHKIGILDRATFSNIEQQSMEFDSDCILPRVTQWEEECRRVLLTQSEKDAGYFFKFNLSAKYRVAMGTRTVYYNAMRQNGIMNANEIRDIEDMNPIPKEDGGEAYLVNGNMVPVTTAMNGQTAKQSGGTALPDGQKAEKAEKALNALFPEEGDKGGAL